MLCSLRHTCLKTAPRASLHKAGGTPRMNAEQQLCIWPFISMCKNRQPFSGFALTRRQHSRILYARTISTNCTVLEQFILDRIRVGCVRWALGKLMLYVLLWSFLQLYCTQIA